MWRAAAHGTAWPQCLWRTSRPYYSAGGRDKIRPARAIRPRFRYKNRPAHPSSLHVRYKTRPARSKWPVLASFVRAGRTLYRFGHQQPEQGELCTAYKVDAEPVDTTAHQVPPVWRVSEGPKSQTAVPVGGGRARLRCPWAAAGPGRAARRCAQPHISDQAPLVWRVPEGPEGTGGLRDRPLRAFRLACGDLAGGGARRRPEHPWGHKQHKAGRPPPMGTLSSPAQQSTRSARNTSGATATHHRNNAQAYKKPTSGSDVGLWWS